MTLSYDDVVAKYEPVLGLEVHVELNTNSKMFCGCSTVFGAEPNTQTCPVCLALPGALPVVNEKAIESTIKIGLALNCSIAPFSRFARKNYFYPDMPKNFQISQYDEPICVDGYVDVEIETDEGPKKFRVEVERVHMEEDTGKSLHVGGATGRIHGAEYSLLDYNRAGIPLVEIVTKIVPGTGKYAPEVAKAYVAELRDILRGLGVSDVKMEQGSLRCDANVSLKPAGSEVLGTRSETKNVNSLRSVERAIRGEMLRHAEILETGGKVKQETRHFQEDTGLTRSGRSKEQAEDYRYFPDPDLAPFQLTDNYIHTIKETIPALPNQLKQEWKTSLGLSDYDVEQLTENKEEADFYGKWIASTKHYKAAVNWILGPIREYLNETGKTYPTLYESIPQLNELLELVETNQLSFSNATGKVFKGIIGTNKKAIQFAEEHQLVQNNSTDQISLWVEQVLAANPDKVQEYKKGKKGLIGLFVGEVKKISKGQADPKMTTQLLEQKLAQ